MTKPHTNLFLVSEQPTFPVTGSLKVVNGSVPTNVGQFHTHSNVTGTGRGIKVMTINLLATLTLTNNQNPFARVFTFAQRFLS